MGKKLRMPQTIRTTEGTEDQPTQQDSDGGVAVAEHDQPGGGELNAADAAAEMLESADDDGEGEDGDSSLGESGELPTGDYSAEVNLLFRLPDQEIELSHVGDKSVIAKGEFTIPGPLEGDLVVVVDGKEQVTRVKFETGLIAGSVGENRRVESLYTTLAEQPEIADADVPAVPVTEGEVAEATSEAQQDQPGGGEAVASDSAAAAAPEVTTSVTSPLQFVSEQARMRQARVDAYYEWQENCAAAKEKFVAAALAHAELKAATKIAKSEEEDTMEAYAKLMKQNPLDQPYTPTVSPMNTRPIAEPVAADPTTLAESSEELAATTTAAPADENGSAPRDWRSVPITELSDLTPKLLESLQEAGATTIGKLEDLREKISMGHEKWPKGIGEAKITLIKDSAMDWLTANRDRQAFAELQSGHVGEQVEDGRIPEYKFEDMGQALEAIERNGGKVDKGMITIVDGCTESGQAAVYLCNEWDCSMADPPTLAETSSSEPNTAFTDAINARAVEIDSDEPGALDDQLNAGYWTQGYEHYEAGGKLATCELNPSPAQDDFIRGWLVAGKTDSGIGPAGSESELVAAVPSSATEQVHLFDPDEI